MYKFKVGDSGKTRVGYTYRVVCTDRKPDDMPIAALISTDGGKSEMLMSCKETGSILESGNPHGYDLLPPTVTKWLNVWIKNGGIHSNLHATEAQAKQGLSSDLFNYIVNAQPVEVPAD